MKPSPIPILLIVSLLTNVLFAQSATPTSAGVAVQPPVATASTVSTPQTDFPQVNTDLDALQKSKDPKFAEDACNALINIREPNLQNQIDEKIRAEKTKAFVVLLETLSASLDPKFPDAPEYRVMLSVAPPIAVAQQVNVLPMSGMDPNAIADPKLRQQYLDAIAENLKKRDNCSRELTLRRDLAYMEANFEVYVDNAYGGTTLGKAEVLKIAQKAGASVEMQKEIAAEIQ